MLCNQFLQKHDSFKRGKILDWLSILVSWAAARIVFSSLPPFLKVIKEDYYKVRVKQGKTVFNNWGRIIPNLNKFLQTDKKNTNIPIEKCPMMWIIIHRSKRLYD